MVTHQTTTTTTGNNNVNMIHMPKSYPSINDLGEAPLNLCVKDSTANSNENNLQNCKVVYPIVKSTTFENNNVCAESKKAHSSNIGKNAQKVVSVPPIIKKINLPQISTTEVTADYKENLSGCVKMAI